MLPIEDLKRYAKALQDMSAMMDKTLLQMAVVNIPGEGKVGADVTHGLLLAKLQGTNAVVYAAATNMLADLKTAEKYTPQPPETAAACACPPGAARYPSKVRVGAVLVDGQCCAQCDRPVYGSPQ